MEIFTRLINEKLSAPFSRERNVELRMEKINIRRRILIPFSERKGLANRKCLYVRPTNQKAAFLNQRPTPDFGCKGKWG